MENEITYTHRHHLFSKQRVYRVGKDGLFWQDENQSVVCLPYQDIISVEAQYSPSRVQANRYLLRLKTKTHGKVDITNTSYKGVGSFEELTESYVPFVQGLHQKIASGNANVVFRQGTSWFGYIFAVLLIFILLAILIGAVFFFLLSGLIGVAVIKVAILIFLFPRLLRYIKRNKPTTYDPLDIPSKVLPKLFVNG